MQKKQEYKRGVFANDVKIAIYVSQKEGYFVSKTTLIDCCIKKYAYREISEIYKRDWGFPAGLFPRTGGWHAPEIR